MHSGILIHVRMPKEMVPTGRSEFPFTCWGTSPADLLEMMTNNGVSAAACFNAMLARTDL